MDINFEDFQRETGKPLTLDLSLLSTDDTECSSCESKGYTAQLRDVMRPSFMPLEPGMPEGTMLVGNVRVFSDKVLCYDDLCPMCREAENYVPPLK